ncbi:MAG: hypothetical protein H8E66_00250, partial [Planctomycetes bacterium]|nr:hypothetical protein [Planctomycetota bacterium]
MANVLPRDKQIEVLHHLVEGNTLRSTSRLTGVHRTTIMKLLVAFGEGCQKLMDERFVNLTLDHCEVDEIWTFVAKKQARLTVDEKAERHDIGDVYLWTAIDQETKLVPAFVLGKRTGDNARKLMRQLASRMTFPSTHDSDAHLFEKGEYTPVTQISTDMLAAYPEAVDQFFGPYARYGQLRKEYRNATMQYTPSEMVGTDRKGIFGIDVDKLWSICTSHVERHNLTIRTLMKRFTRLNLGFSKKLDNLAAACQVFLAFYNFVWRTRFDDKSGQAGRLRPTAAMAAGVT